MTVHITPRRTYYLVFAVLMILTATTTGVAFIDMGPFNVVVALFIASIKAVLVVLFFMHVLHVTNLTKVFVAAGIVWLAILIALTLNDYLTRGWDPISRPF
jgi:caa(3)-type oxidase, subunit IV